MTHLLGFRVLCVCVQNEAKKLEAKLGRFSKEQAAARRAREDMHAKHAWIAGEAK